VRGSVVATRPPVERVAGAEPLRKFFRECAADYLLRGARGRSPLRAPAEAAGRFRQLRGQLPEPARPVLDLLEEECDRRRQLDRQNSLHFWLHAWLWLHLPLSAALLVLTFVHALSTLRY
jgi:hypothetical protein